MIKKFLVYLNPKFWLLSRTIDLEYDSFLRKLAKEHKFEKIPNFGNYYYTLGPISLWTKNYPYASFTLSCESQLKHPQFTDKIPKRTTIFMLHEKLKKETGYDI